MKTTANKQQERFINALATYLCEDQAKKSIFLEMQKPAAIEWAKVYRESPLHGYCSVEEGAQKIAELFGLRLSSRSTGRKDNTLS